MGHSEELSKSTERGWSSETLFRRARRGASSALSDGGESAARRAAPRDLRSACALLCDTDDLYEALFSPGGVEYGAGDLAPYDATVTRRFDALVALSRRPATTMGAVLAKALVVSHLREWKNHETEAGELAIDLVHELAVMAERDDLDQGRLPADSALARGCSAFFIDDSLYEAAVCGGQMSQSAIKLALQRRADALDVVINHEATTIAAAVAKAEVVLHLSEWVGHDATDIGLLALAVLRDLRSISRFA